MNAAPFHVMDDLPSLDDVEADGDFPNVLIEPDHPLLAGAKIRGELKRNNMAAQLYFGH